MAELQRVLERRQKINEGEQPAAATGDVFNPYTAFPEFTRKEISNYRAMFRKYDEDQSGQINFEELKRMMEKLGEPQTHIQLRQMISQIDEDNDGEISFREFLLIFHKAKTGELQDLDGFRSIVNAASVDVSEVGVGGAKAFFEAKAAEQSKGSKFEAEIKADQEARRAAAAEAKERKAAFEARRAKFDAP